MNEVENLLFFIINILFLFFCNYNIIFNIFVSFTFLLLILLLFIYISSTEIRQSIHDIIRKRTRNEKNFLQ